MLRTVILPLTLLVICDYVTTQSDTGCYKGHERTYKRVKRGKYYPGPPQRFYSRPPASYPIRGPFSQTPPPTYMADEGSHYPGPGLRPYKVSKRPPNDGLGDEDLNNVIKHLTKQDLDKIIEHAYVKEKNYNKYENSKPTVKDYDNSMYRETVDTQPSYQDPIITKFRDVEFNKYNDYVDVPENVYSRDNIRNLYDVNLETEESVFKPQTYLSPNKNNPDKLNESGSVYFVESNEEDNLPKPVNMREEDIEVSYTNKVPSVVEAELGSYKLEDFSNLPLMNFYDSKLHSVSSYHVPHYTVTQNKAHPPSPASAPLYPSSLLRPSPAAAYIKAPPLEPAPPISAAKAQSDAHLKAIKIWSNRSKGIAYTLHDDGSLTLEKPGWPKYG